MDIDQAQQRVQAALRVDGGLAYTAHALQRVDERAILHPDILNILKSGSWPESPVAYGLSGWWEVPIFGPDALGARVKVVVRVHESERKPVWVATAIRL